MPMKPSCPKTTEYLEKVNDANQSHPLVHAVAQLIQATVDNNEKANRPAVAELRMFEGKEPAPISAFEYVQRLMKYGGISPSCLVQAMIYLERMKPKVSNVWLTTRNIQRLYLVAVMTAAKFSEDFYFSNKRWAEIGAVSVKELNNLELHFLAYTNFTLVIQPAEYEQMQSAVLSWRPVVQKPQPQMHPQMVPYIPMGRDAAVGSLTHQFQKSSLNHSNSFTDVATAADFMRMPSGNNRW